ncbi:MAG TPA: hypothetical protein VI643_00740 [Planctomycetota bacterium]|nr:hypothetical protein [Planctomycetota bacterium]
MHPQTRGYIAGVAATLAIVLLGTLLRSRASTGYEGDLLPEMIHQLTVQDAEYPSHGSYHRIKPEVERDLWKMVSELPARDRGDETLLQAVENVYTKHHSNFCNGYIFHYPYLVSRKAIALVEKLEREYPDSPLLARALLLKAFATRVKPPPEGHERNESFDEQLTWRPDAAKAREIYKRILDRHPNGPEAKAAKAALEEEPFEIDLPFGADDDPRKLPE